MQAAPLGDADLVQLERLGIAEDEARRQLDRFRRLPTHVRIVRPCRVGDGIRLIDDREGDRLIGLHEEAARQGRFTRFVPASGAATRMFGELLAFARTPGSPIPRAEIARRAGASDAAAGAVARLLARLPDFPFAGNLAAALKRAGHPDGLETGDVGAVLDALLAEPGLGYSTRPKGLLDFHVYADGARTAFEEHLVEAADYVADAEGICRLHFTISPEHRDGFEALLGRVRRRHEERRGVRYEVSFSFQKPSTDTLAADAGGRPFRDESGRLVLRPGGHGALIENLQDLGGDLVYMKNIDNVQPDRLKPVVARWKRILGGALAQLERRSRELLAELEKPGAREAVLDGARSFAATRLHIGLDGRFEACPVDKRRALLIDRLRRPMRVCGVVRNTGEPGGGPFWVRGPDGSETPQIVEQVQLDPEDAGQKEAFSGATHFNPVDLVCALTDPEGRAYDLRRFVDPDTATVTRKMHGGRELLALERPGLWNGAMAGWNTVFVEVPLETFSPVKTLFDLLRADHRAEPQA